MTTVYRYFPPALNIDEVEAWAEQCGYSLAFVERGPDGLLRGAVTILDDAMSPQLNNELGTVKTGGNNDVR